VKLDDFLHFFVSRRPPILVRIRILTTKYANRIKEKNLGWECSPSSDLGEIMLAFEAELWVCLAAYLWVCLWVYL
jgi:hypothetical protein